MRLAGLAAAAMFGACGQEPSGYPTPEEAAREFSSAVARLDMKKVRSTLTEASRPLFDRVEERFRKRAERSGRGGDVRIAKAERHEKQPWAMVSVESRGTTERVFLRREGGSDSWRVDAQEDLAEAADLMVAMEGQRREKPPSDFLKALFLTAEERPEGWKPDTLIKDYEEVLPPRLTDHAVQRFWKAGESGESKVDLDFYRHATLEEAQWSAWRRRTMLQDKDGFVPMEAGDEAFYVPKGERTAAGFFVRKGTVLIVLSNVTGEEGAACLGKIFPRIR